MSTRVATALVLADDRTGALETAGMVAQRCGHAVPVGVVGGPPPRPGPVTVVDLASRHLDPTAAADRAVSVHAGHRIDAHLHKLDSTLRGNWAEELVARRVLVALPKVLVVAAFPAVGRVCRDGVVLAGGVPVAEGPAGRDARRPVTSSRPAELLRLAGAEDVVELATGAAVGSWLGGPGRGFAVADADDDEIVDDLASRWADAHHATLFAGTAGSVAAAVEQLLGPGEGTTPPPILGPVTVVSGSLHEAARRQVAELRRAIARGELGNVGIIESVRPAQLPVPAADARAAASEIAAEVGRLDRGTSVLLIGGDTAAAVLGDGPVMVGGTVAPGMPWCTTIDGRIVITRSGGFGGDGALVELLAGRMRA